jgi:PST family polysaccharide transporter
VWGQLAGTAATSIVLWALSSWRPSFQVSRDRLRSMLRYGIGIAIVGVLGEAVLNADYIIIGVRLGDAALGFYLLAFRIPELVIASGFRVANTVFFPFYSRLRDESADAAATAGADRERLVTDELQRGYLQTLRIGALVAIPAGFVMASLARAIVLTLYGDRWAASATPLGLIAVWAAFSALTSLPGALFKAIGRSWILTANAVLELAMVLPALWFAAGHGINSVAAAHVGVKVAYFCVLTIIVWRVLGVTARETFSALLPGLLVGAATSLVVMVPAHMLPPAVALLVGGSIAVVVYAGLLRLCAPATFHTLVAPVVRRYGTRAKRPYARAAATRG